MNILATRKVLTTTMSATIVASVLALSVVTQTSEAKAYACKSYPTQTVGVRKLKFKARAVARKGWSTQVKSQFGVPWSLWSLAKQKSITCSKINTNQGKKWRCLAWAKPCLYVVK